MTLYFAPRTCTEKIGNSSKQENIAYFRDRPAYVLLAEPGAGKSTLFEQEAKESGGEFLSARDFIVLENRQWQDKTLFIDGLDEARAGKDDPRTPLDEIRQKLTRLGCRRFRISCREADWLGRSDQQDLLKVSRPEETSTLYLDPLTGDSIRHILRHKAVDADAFIAKAESFGLAGLLSNPQTLEMLISAVKNGQAWPATKQDVYRLATEQLATETNEKHQIAEKNSLSPQKLIETAGLLCAIQLIANLSGYSQFSHGCPEPGRVALNKLDLPDPVIAKQALKTRLFRKHGSDYSYVHRSVAEYLAALYIAARIKAGLPVGRVLALTRGADGGFVAAMRGLMGWLCALSPEARNILLEADPLGAVIYGDAQLFSPVTKSRLLQALIRKPSEIISYPKNDSRSTAFKSITTMEMANELVEVFKSTDRSDGFQYLIYCLLTGLCHSEPIAEIKPALQDIIRDQTYMDHIRDNALRAFIHQYPDDEDMESLYTLAEDFRNEKIADTSYNMLETLLEKLFPVRIKAADILQYLIHREKSHVINNLEFWRKHFPARVTDEELPDVLDELARRGPAFLEIASHQNLFDMAGQLLIRGLAVHGLKIGAERLYQWLSIDIDDYQYRFSEEQCRQIAVWLTAQPELCLALIGEGIKQMPNSTNFRHEIILIFLRLHGAALPDTLGLWWLEQALKAVNFELSKSYVEQAFWCLFRKQGGRGLSLDQFVDWVEAHPRFQETYQALNFTPIDESRIQHAQSKKKWALQREASITNRLSYFNERIDQIADGIAEPGIFHDLAHIFVDRGQSHGKSGEHRLSEFLCGDKNLTAAAIKGLHNILRRTDLPTIEEIFSIDAAGRWHLIRLPFLVNIDLLYRENPNMLDSLSDDLAGKALAFAFTERSFDDDWFVPLCKTRMPLVAGLFTDYIIIQLVAKTPRIQGLYELASNPNYQGIAKLTVMTILNQYPVRAYKDHTRNLELLLKAAITHIDRHMLLALIEKKLAYKSMDTAQRVYWLAAGLILNPVIFHERIKTALTGHTERINHFSAFWLPYFSKEYTQYPLPEQTMGWLIEIFAPRSSLIWGSEAGSFAANSIEEASYVGYLLDCLANNPGDESAAILTGLMAKPELHVWRPQIQNALQTQKITHREAMFRHPDAFQVIETLNNRKPANVEDLAALTVAMLRELARQTHTGNTDSYKQFWNCNSKKKPVTPRHEELCRDYLAEFLKPRLAQYDVSIEPESHQANEKRADLKLSFMRNGQAYYLPIEIKGDYNEELWRAIDEQLIPRYTISTETQGRGLYLVLWFADKSKRLPRPPQDLKRPETAEELENMLKEKIAPQFQKLIEVVVLDVSTKISTQHTET